MANKTTKKEFFGMLLEMESVKVNEELVDFINHEIELLDKKASKSASKRENANSELAGKLLKELQEIGNAVTISEFMKLSEVAKTEGLSNQKISSIFSKLKDNGGVTRTVVKGKAYFSAQQVDPREWEQKTPLPLKKQLTPVRLCGKIRYKIKKGVVSYD